MPEKQVKSRERVAEHGEVFTAEREVNAMLDLVKNETERIESRFLEPACGDGNFLAEILRRKLAVVRKKYGSAQKRQDFEKWSVIAVMNIYGVELLPDNADACRERLFEIWDKAYRENCGTYAGEKCRAAVRFVLERNILCGDALSLKQENEEAIIFSEWSFVNETKVKRRDFRLNQMLEGGVPEVQLKIWEDDEETHAYIPKAQGRIDWVYDEETRAYIPAPCKEYPPTDYWRVQYV